MSGLVAFAVTVVALRFFGAPFGMALIMGALVGVVVGL